MAAVCAAMTAGALLAGPAWRGEALRAWTRGAHQVKEATVAGGTLRIVCGGPDAHLYSSPFDLPAKATQEVVFRARGTCAGRGELFWMAPGKGATAKQSCAFDWMGDGAWHDYRLRPYWQGEGRIGRLRLDFPEAATGAAFEIAGVEIAEGAATQALPADRIVGAAFTLAARKPAQAHVLWAGGSESGVRRETVRVPGDGRPHRFYVHLADRRAWQGEIALVRVETPPGVEQIGETALVAEEPTLPPDLVVADARAADAFNRVGAPVPVTVRAANLGTADAQDVRLVPTSLPPGVRLDESASRLVQTLGGGEQAAFTAVLDVAAAQTFTARFALRGPGAPAEPIEVSVAVQPSLGLPKAAAVPEPRPVATDYDLAALYFPGWNRASAWARVWNACPERRPVLGWYDEANPDVVDWQIKWLVENGIRTLYVDWYWDRGAQSLDHWVKAFYRAKHRRHLKWALMWANHNAPGSHSPEDQRAVTAFWIENYFRTPEYLRRDGKPVVWIWSAQNMARDAPAADGCRGLLEISREMARAAGFPGIHFIAMKWPEADCSAQTIRRYKDMGFDETGLYHFMDHGGRCASNRRFPFAAVADANPENWRRQHEANVLPFLPSLSTGWDDRPWNDRCEIYGKNVEDFRRICRAAKAFADETGVRRLCLGPLNEWGEGSYAEPNAEFGFGFYEAVRDTFCKRPKDGWPLNYGPKDVGLGPYDLPPPARPARATAWSFADGNLHGWSPLMNVADVRATAEGLSFRSTSRDPALVCTFAPVAAARFDRIVVRMKATGPAAAAQLFWMRPGGQAAESASVSTPLVCDGAFRDYVFPVASSRLWRGRIGGFRFDPANAAGVHAVVASIRLVEAVK